MDNDETCATCQFGRFKPDLRIGMCVAKPPTPIVVGKGTNLAGHDVPAVDGFFPPVTKDNWCGAYRRENRNGADEMDGGLVAAEPEGHA